MADSQPEATVDSKIVDMWRTDGRLYAIAGFLIGLMAFPLVAALDASGDVQRFLEDIVPEAVGILVTVFFIDRLNRRRDAKNAEEALKRQLVMDVASTSNEIAKNAVHQLRRKGWLEGENGLLKGANLYRASLQGAVLSGANMRRTVLGGANLQDADLYGATLQDAGLGGANLQDATLYEANLRGAKLGYANLQDANLYDASLTSANLAFANLQDAILLNAIFDELTVLPDLSRWTPETDMKRFSDPEHPNFWRSDEPMSPAFRGWNEE